RGVGPPRRGRMKITRLSSALVQLTRYPLVFPMNCYLVHEEDGLTLVDSTTSSPADDVTAMVKQLGKELRRDALTHAHGDHVAGDSFQTRGGIAVSGDLRPLFPFPAMATWNKQVALASALSLRALGPSLLAVGHGAALSEPTAAMDRAIESARRAFN